MQAGLTVFNDKQSVQVDETYRNMLLVASGQFTISTATSGIDNNPNSWFNKLMPVWSKATNALVLAVRVAGPNGLCLGGSSLWQGVKVSTYVYNTATSTPMQYYFYDLVDAAPGDPYGLEVFDQAGRLSYSSSDYPLNIVDFLSTTQSNYVGAHDGLAWAVTGGGYQVSIDTDNVEESIRYAYFSGNTLVFRTVYTDYPSYSWIIAEYGVGDAQGMVIDVRNVPKNYFRG